MKILTGMINQNKKEIDMNWTIKLEQQINAISRIADRCQSGSCCDEMVVVRFGPLTSPKTIEQVTQILNDYYTHEFIGGDNSIYIYAFLNDERRSFLLNQIKIANAPKAWHDVVLSTRTDRGL